MVEASSQLEREVLLIRFRWKQVRKGILRGLYRREIQAWTRVQRLFYSGIQPGGHWDLDSNVPVPQE
jgi:hypothetical protein